MVWKPMNDSREFLEQHNFSLTHLNFSFPFHSLCIIAINVTNWINAENLIL